MEWTGQPDGTLQKEMDGVQLELDPGRRRLRIVVTDYHARPVELDLGELQGIAAPVSGTPTPPCIVPEHSIEPVAAKAEPLPRAPVAGVVVVLALVLYCGGRPGRKR